MLGDANLFYLKTERERDNKYDNIRLVFVSHSLRYLLLGRKNQERNPKKNQAWKTNKTNNNNSAFNNSNGNNSNCQYPLLSYRYRTEQIDCESVVRERECAYHLSIIRVIILLLLLLYYYYIILVLVIIPLKVLFLFDFQLLFVFFLL